MSRILVIDDNEAIRHVLATFLPSFGHTVTVAESGEAGLDAADGVLTDLILVDVEMPRMSGIAVCETLKRDPRRSHIPVLMMTGNLARDVAYRAKRAGAIGVLGKPFTWEQLIDHFSRHLPAVV